MAVWWDVAPYDLLHTVLIFQRSLLPQSSRWIIMTHIRRKKSSYLLPWEPQTSSACGDVYFNNYEMANWLGDYHLSTDDSTHNDEQICSSSNISIFKYPKKCTSDIFLVVDNLVPQCHVKNSLLQTANCNCFVCHLSEMAPLCSVESSKKQCTQQNLVCIWWVKH
jgi:hypothetical protein